LNRETEGGFSLVEVLVAFAIMAGAIVLSFQIFADGLRRLTNVEARMQAIDVARFELSRLSSSGQLSEGAMSGTTEGVDWKITVAPAGEASGDPGRGLRIFKVAVFAGGESDGAADVPLIETLALGEFQTP
jgi:general secretion pathway protein I